MLRGDALDVGDAVVHRSPLDAELAGERAPECRLVNVPGGLGLVEDRPAVERCPQPILTLGQIGDEHMGVDLRVAGPAGAVLEGRADQPAAALDQVPAASAAHLARVRLEVAHAGSDRLALGTKDGALLARAAE